MPNVLVETAPDKVKFPGPPKEVLEATVIAPEAVDAEVVLELIIAPTPLPPLSVKGLATLYPAKSTNPSDVSAEPTVTLPVPSAEL